MNPETYDNEDTWRQYLAIATSSSDPSCKDTEIFQVDGDKELEEAETSPEDVNKFEENLKKFESMRNAATSADLTSTMVERKNEMFTLDSSMKCSELISIITSQKHSRVLHIIRDGKNQCINIYPL